MSRRNQRASNAKKRSQRNRSSLRRQLTRGIPIIVATIFLTLFYGSVPTFRRLETSASDFAMRVREPQTNADIVFVRITDNDYKSYFDNNSPLDPQKLIEVIDQVASAHPKVIAVDIDTSSESFRTLKPSADLPPIIWARVATYSPIHEKYVLSAVLGQHNVSVDYGLVNLIVDSDGVVRRYSRWFDTEDGIEPSFAWAMLQKFRNQQTSQAYSDVKNEFLTNYAGSAKGQHFVKVAVEQLREMSGPGFGEKSIFKDKMVIIGGDYAAQDEHNTPVGLMTGAEVLAWIAETEQNGGGRQPIGKFAIVLLAVLDSAVLLSLIYLFGFWKTVVVSIVLIPTLGVVLSLLLFGSLNYAGTLVIGLLAVLCYEIYERAKDHFKKWRQTAIDTHK